MTRHKVNNYASVKTEVEPAMINVAGSGTNYSLSWQAGTGKFVLQGAVNSVGSLGAYCKSAGGGWAIYLCPAGHQRLSLLQIGVAIALIQKHPNEKTF